MLNYSIIEKASRRDRENNQTHLGFCLKNIYTHIRENIFHPERKQPTHLCYDHWYSSRTFLAFNSGVNTKRNKTQSLKQGGPDMSNFTQFVKKCKLCKSGQKVLLYVVNAFADTANSYEAPYTLSTLLCIVIRNITTLDKVSAICRLCSHSESDIIFLFSHYMYSLAVYTPNKSTLQP